MAKIVVEGFVIIPPVDDYRPSEKTAIITTSHRTFSTNPKESWAIFSNRKIDDPDFSSCIMKWYDLGYRLQSAKMEIEYIQ